MGKRKKSRFKVRYLFLLFILFLLYEGWKAFFPVDSYIIKWSYPVEEYKEYEVKRLIPEALPKSLRPVTSSILRLDWVKDVRCHKSLKGVMTIFIRPRVPVSRIYDMKGFGVDKEGMLFRVADIDTLPVIKVNDDLKTERIKEAVQLLLLTKDMNVKEVEVTSYGLESRIGDINVIWGEGSYPEKYRLLKRIYKKAIISSGKLDFRFDNQVVLRR